MSFVEYKNPVSVYNNQQKREYEKGIISFM